MSDMTPREAADEFEKGVEDGELVIRRPYHEYLEVLLDHARATAPEDGDLAQRVRDAITLMRQQDDETLDHDLYRVLVEMLAAAPSVAAPPHRVLVHGEADASEWQDCDGEDCATCAPGTVRDPERAS